MHPVKTAAVTTVRQSWWSASALLFAASLATAPTSQGQVPMSGDSVVGAAGSVPAGPRRAALRSGIGEWRTSRPGATAQGTQRPRAVEHSEWFYRRQDLHRYASFLTMPLFVAQYLVGEELLKNGDDAAGWAKGVHPALAGGIWGLFAVNTVTGVWNWWDSRGEPEGRVKRTLHAALMLAADVGFATIGEAEDDEGFGASDGRREHRRHAIVSMSIATAGYLLMLSPLGRD